MQDKYPAPAYNAAGFRLIREGTPLASTEYRRPDGKTIQMRGEGPEVEALLTSLDLATYCARIDMAEEGRDG